MEEFDFQTWCTASGLKKPTEALLKKQDYDTLDILQTMTVVDLVALDKVTGGQARALRNALGLLGNANFIVFSSQPPVAAKETPKSKEVEEDGGLTGPLKDKTLSQAGLSLDTLLKGLNLGDPSDECDKAKQGGAQGYAPPMTGYSHRSRLIIKATTKKAQQIQMFLPETVKQRQAKKNKELFNWSKGDDGAVVIKADNHLNKLNITKDEWGAANQRLCHYLLQTNELSRDNIEDYMSYTILIHEYADKYDWYSVLEYDHRYRELQAETGMSWGMAVDHLYDTVLIRKEKPHMPGPVKTNYREKSFGTGTKDSEALCCLHLKGDCPYGEYCKFKHVKRD